MLYLRALYLLCLWFSSFHTLAFSLADNPCYQNYDNSLAAEFFYVSSDFVSDEELSQFELPEALLAKAGRIAEKIRNFDKISLSLEDIEKSLAFLSLGASSLKKEDKEGCGLYIKSSEDGLPLAMIYTGTGIYLDLQSLDEGQKSGSFKTFSRSIEIESEEVRALLQSELRNAKQKKTMSRELEALYALRGASGQPEFYSWQVFTKKSNGTLVETLALETEFFPGNLKYAKKVLNEEQEWATLIYSSLEALSSLYQKGFVHRDIKPETILVDDAAESAVFTDFGLSYHQEHLRFGHNIAGTRGYVAPELCENKLLMGFAFHSINDMQKAELFALGLSFVNVMFSWKNPLYKQNHHINTLFMSKKRSEFPSKEVFLKELQKLDKAYKNLMEELPYSDSFKEALAALIHPDPKERVSLDQARELWKNVL